MVLSEDKSFEMLHNDNFPIIVHDWPNLRGLDESTCVVDQVPYLSRQHLVFTV